MIRLDFLPSYPNIKLYQDTNSICINTDTMALGEFLEVYKKDTILDIGTNNGSLLLYASRFNPTKMIGIDINKSALELAKKNLQMNGISNYEIKEADANTYIDKEVDIIVCNPPYFKSSNNGLSKTANMNLAKHEDNLSLENLVKTITKNLKSNGKLFISYQSSRLVELLLELEKNHLNVKVIKFVYDEKKENAVIVLIKAVKGGNKGVNVIKPLVIHR